MTATPTPDHHNPATPPAAARPSVPLHDRTATAAQVVREALGDPTDPTTPAAAVRPDVLAAVREVIDRTERLAHEALTTDAALGELTRTEGQAVPGGHVLGRIQPAHLGALVRHVAQVAGLTPPTYTQAFAPGALGVMRAQDRVSGMDRIVAAVDRPADPDRPWTVTFGPVQEGDRIAVETLTGELLVGTLGPNFRLVDPDPVVRAHGKLEDVAADLVTLLGGDDRD